MRVLIVEDNPVDTTKCIVLLKKVGAAEIEAVPTVAAALVHLEDVLDNKRPAPELIVLDLAFPLESGFEVLRRWRAHPKLQNIRIYRVDRDGRNRATPLRILWRQGHNSKVGWHQRIGTSGAGIHRRVTKRSQQVGLAMRYRASKNYTNQMRLC